MEQISMFDLLMPTFKINKPLRLIEFFAGYGSQALALKYLGAKFEHWKICEWSLNSIIAYASLHRNELAFYDKDFSQPLSKNEIAEYLFQKGVSIDYNQPATLDQLKRVAESKLRLCYNAIQCTHNLVDISRVKGRNLDIEETDKYTYLLTYSFPCQDLSLAGKGKGMEKGSGTRSGLLWEVERILSECDVKPQVLVMENVTQVHGAGNEEHFKQWVLRLEEMGYQSYWNDMSAVCYGIPQTRNRTFMVSIHGEYNYKFPKPTKLKLRLKDMLESNVDEKFYLSQKMIEYISAVGGGITQTTIQKSTSKSQDHLQQNKTKGQEQQITCPRSFPEEFDLSKVHGTKNRAELLLLLLSKNGELEKHDLPNGCDSSLNNPKIREVSNTITTRYDAGIQNQQQIGMCVVEKGEKNKSLKETLEKTELENVKDVAYLDTYNRNAITDGTAKTILTGVDFRNHDFLLIKNATTKGFLEAEDGDGVDISSRMESHRGTVQKDKAQTLTTVGGAERGVVVKENIPNKVNKIGNYSPSGHNAITTVQKDSLAANQLRIRKLTPRECFRLMGLKDEDIDLVMENQTNSSAYHLAGDSIVTTCLMAIFGELLGIDWKEQFDPKKWWVE